MSWPGSNSFQRRKENRQPQPSPTALEENKPIQATAPVLALTLRKRSVHGSSLTTYKTLLVTGLPSLRLQTEQLPAWAAHLRQVLLV